MWLLELHFAFSILCFLCFYGSARVGREKILRNGWLDETKKKGCFISNIIFIFIVNFIPIINILLIIAIWTMICCKKEDLERWLNNEDN